MKANLRDRALHNLANGILYLATKEYRKVLRTHIEIGRLVLNDDKLYKMVLDKARGV